MMYKYVQANKNLSLLRVDVLLKKAVLITGHATI